MYVIMQYHYYYVYIKLMFNIDFYTPVGGLPCQLGCPKIVWLLVHGKLTAMTASFYTPSMVVKLIIIKALMHTQPSIVLLPGLPGIHTTMYIL